MTLRNQSQIDLIWIRLRELELAVSRILRILNDWHPVEEPDTWSEEEDRFYLQNQHPVSGGG